MEALDKIHVCLDLLIKNKYIERKGKLKDIYESVIGIYNMERNEPKMWEMVHRHEILSLFQMEQQSGIQGIALTKPTSVSDLATLNSVIRLMAQDKNAEQPLNKFARFKKDINEWYKEMELYGLTKAEQQILEPILLPSSGLCESQEGFMSLVQMPECGGFDLTWADRLRKSIAKKKPEEFMALEKEYFEQVEKKKLSKNLCNYVWKVLVYTSRGYGFNKSHTLAYSLIALQEMNLAYKYPIIFWNTACLIVDSGSEGTSTDYTKIAQSVNRIRRAGINISLIDINKSELNFTPNEESNSIMFGMKAIVNLNDELINRIKELRPYQSMIDFYYRVNPNKQAMIALIKSGAFDQFKPRKRTMVEYLWLTCDKKKRLTLQNLPGLIKYGLLPEDSEEHIMARRIFEFNRYLKAQCRGNADTFALDSRAINFLNEINSEELITDGFMNKKNWDKKIYQPWMDIFRAWINTNKEEILDQLNTKIFYDDWQKYAKGNVSAWEMESCCFYFHKHELSNVNYQKYGFSNFFSLNKEPEIERVFYRGENKITLFKINKICGTCIAKDKDKSIVYLLTREGVVPVRFRQEYFSIFDKQISERQQDGSKKIIEKSWFNRGNMIIIQGIRRENNFIAKKYNSTPGHTLYHIDEVMENGELILRANRRKGTEEDDE